MTAGAGGPAGSADAPDDVAAELAALVGGFRGYLERLDRAGRFFAPAAASPRPQLGAAETEVELSETEIWQSTQEPEPDPRPTADPGPAEDPASAQRPAVTLAGVREALGDCQRCKLAATRTHIVFGVGSPDAPLLFVGEAPGAEEDRRGEPFVGRAGQLLDRMIAAMGWTRDSVYIANVLKCRPPRNRDPAPDEVAACEPFLARQIEALAPRIIVALGRPAAQLLLRTRAPISAMRGRFHAFRGIPVMPTFHPAFLLRSPERKRDAWSDLKQVIAELDRLEVRSPHPPRV